MMANPVELLMEEHEIISKALDNVLNLKELIQADPDKFKSEMKKYIDFFRNYADKFHHQKEERILFIQMNNKNNQLGDGVIKEMYDNHADFREILTDIESSTDEGNFDKAFRAFEKYNDALSDHIAVENQEVFQIALSIFSDADLEKMAHQFTDTDHELGMDYKKSMEKIVE